MADKKSEVKEKDGQIKFKLLDKKELYLHTQVASGTFGDEDYTVDAAIPGNSIIVNYKGKRAMLDIRDIVKAGLLFIEGE